MKLNTTTLRNAGLIASAALATAAANAADTGAVAAITSAQTDALSVAGALVGMGVAIWGAMYLYRKFFK